jgi:hypothetical protein
MEIFSYFPFPDGNDKQLEDLIIFSWLPFLERNGNHPNPFIVP